MVPCRINAMKTIRFISNQQQSGNRFNAADGRYHSYLFVDCKEPQGVAAIKYGLKRILCGWNVNLIYRFEHLVRNIVEYFNVLNWFIYFQLDLYFSC